MTSTFWVTPTPPICRKLKPGEQGTQSFTVTSMAAPDEIHEVILGALLVGEDGRRRASDWLSVAESDRALSLPGGTTKTVAVIARPTSNSPRGEHHVTLAVAADKQPNEVCAYSQPVVIEVVGDPPGPIPRWLIRILAIAGGCIAVGSALIAWKGIAMRREIASLERRLQEVTGERDQAIRLRTSAELELEKLKAVPPPRPPRPPDPSTTYSVPIARWPQRGPTRARVTMVVAHDYGCGFCERMRGTIEDLLRKYGNDLRVVYAPYILHPTATATTLAACAASLQSKFEVLDPLLWEGARQRKFDTKVHAPDGTVQNCWDAPAGCPNLIGFATQAGLDVVRFKSNMQHCAQELRPTAVELYALGVHATPTFFINGRYLVGAVPMERLSALIDEEKRKADERIRRGTREELYYQEWVIKRGALPIALPAYQ